MSNPSRSVRFPLIVMLLGIVAIVFASFAPPSLINEPNRNMMTPGVLLLGGTLLAGWMFFRQPIARKWTLMLFGTPFVAFFGAIATGAIQFDGNMGMLLKNPFHDQTSVIESHRQSQPSDTSRKIVLVPDQDTDCPAYRGRDRSGIIAGPELQRDWATKKPREVWRQPCGGGYAGMSVVKGYLFTIEQRRGNEVVVCYDASTGQEVWKYEYQADFRESMGGPGPRTTPTVFDGLVYSLGANGQLTCLDGRDGSVKWETNILTNNDNVMWGMSGSPLVFDDLVVVNPGAQSAASAGRAMIAYDRLTGAERWHSGESRAGYSSPQLSELDGVRQILLFDAGGIAGYDPNKGTQLWSFPWETQQGINVSQPIIIPKADGKPTQVFISSGYGVGGALLEVRQNGESWSVKQVYRTNIKTMRSKFASPVVWDGCLIGLNDGILECVEIRDGRELWKDDRRARRGQAYGHGQILRTGDLIVVFTEFGEIVLVEANRDELLERGRIQAIKGSKTWNPPTLVDGRLYVRDAEEMACYDLRP